MLFLQGDEGFPGFPGPKVTEVPGFWVVGCVFIHADNDNELFTLFASFQGAAGNAGTKGSPGRTGNQGQRVCEIYDSKLQRPTNMQLTERVFDDD